MSKEESECCPGQGRRQTGAVRSLRGKVPPTECHADLLGTLWSVIASSLEEAGGGGA